MEDKAGAAILEGGFWMDSIKTHCYATFDGKEAAEKAMAALQGLQWPVQSFKRLEAKIGDMSAEEVGEAGREKVVLPVVAADSVKYNVASLIN